MAHLTAPQPANPHIPVFFNVDGVVGAFPADNRREDVLLVQFAYATVGRNPGKWSPELVAACQAVRPTGIIDDATITAIREMQKFTHSPIVDGRVSPASGYTYGSGYFSIVHINSCLQEYYLDIWPRIDKIPDCPPELVTMVVSKVGGV